MSNDRDNNTEDALRRALSGEAGRVAPHGDGLMKIQQRVSARESRMRWLRPALAGGTAVIVIAAGVGGYAIAKHNSGNASVSPAHSSDPSIAPAPAAFPADAIFPFTATADEQTWEQEFTDGHSPWISDPTAVTQAWVENYLSQVGHFDYVDQTSGTSGDVVVKRSLGGSDHPVSVVHLVKYNNAWLVTGASDPNGALTFTSPTAGSAISSPVTVSGPGYGVDMQAHVEVRNATTPDLFGQADTGPFGNGTSQWSASVPVNATSDAGVVVVTVASPADGKVGTLAAEKVTFGSNAHSTTGDQSGFYGVQGGVIEQFAADGTARGPIQGSDSEGTVVEVRQFGDSLYFTARAGDCLPSLYSIPTSGGTATKVATSTDSDYGIVGFDLTADGSKLTYLESSGCHQSMAGKGKLVFTNLLGEVSTRTINFPSEPPAVIGDPVWESDGIHVDAWVETGMSGYLARYDSTTGDNPAPSTSACKGYDPNDGLGRAVTTSPDGTLWFATQTGTAMQVISCNESGPTVKFTVPKNDTPTALSVDSSGNVLLTDSSGRVWSGTAGGKAAELPTGGGVSSATW